jgi:hypothetical protein
MAQFESSDLSPVRLALRALLDATPVNTPRYNELEQQYDALHAAEQRALIGVIAANDADYVAFINGITDVMTEIQSAQTHIAKVAALIAKVAKVVEVAGKVASKLA